ncbi:MAG: YjbH domain-containing protein, partial [Candidatus Neomarinimicrobiota bacterium]
NVPYCEILSDPVCRQDYKDKGFNYKIRIKEEGRYPAIAVGINDIAGTGLYGSEYVVASYGINNLDFHYGIGWGAYNGTSKSFKNPLGYIYDGFNTRDESFNADYAFQGTGSFQKGRYFSGRISPFLGISYALNERTILKFERDTTLTTGKINYPEPKTDYSIGIDYKFSNNFTIGYSFERGSYASLRLIYKNNPKQFVKPYEYKSASHSPQDNKYETLIKNIEENGIGVNKIVETGEFIGLELTQFIHPNLDVIEDIIKTASMDTGFKKPIKKDMKIANLNVLTEIDDSNAKVIYSRKNTQSFNTKFGLKFRPFLASREQFFKGALLLENDSQYVIKDDLIFTSNLKYSLYDNFDDLTIPPRDTFPAQVRSDVKDYLRSFDGGIFIGRAQFDYYKTLKKNNHLMVTAGILEEMFMGYGFEYLYFKNNSNYAVGFEIFDVVKRDYKMRFDRLEYRNTVASANFYYRNYNIVPFDMKISLGEYLAGDIGTTFEFSRSFENGTKFGIFATFTDVTSEQFGEGGFDKGIFFNIPIYGNFINYSWRPLTKDPGAKLNRMHNLHDLLVRFQPIN